MDEGIAMRALTIGVSVLIAVATMSAVMAYYNVAKQSVISIGTGMDFAGQYTSSIRNSLIKTNPNGTDVKNILNYFYKDPMTRINLYINLFTNTTVTQTRRYNYTNVNNPTNTTTEQNFNNVIKYIFPKQKFTMSYYTDSKGILVITIRSV